MKKRLFSTTIQYIFKKYKILEKQNNKIKVIKLLKAILKYLNFKQTKTYKNRLRKDDIRRIQHLKHFLTFKNSIEMIKRKERWSTTA